MVAPFLHQSRRKLMLRDPLLKSSGQYRTSMVVLLAGITSCYVSEWCCRGASRAKCW
jgi:hypothetical protein